MPVLALPDPPLSDGLVVLRGFESSDVSRPAAACQDPEIPRWTLVPSPYTQDDARDYLRHTASGLTAGTRAALAIAEPVVHRPECEHLPDVYFARLAGE